MFPGTSPTAELELSAPLTAGQVRFHCNTANEVRAAAAGEQARAAPLSPCPPWRLAGPVMGVSALPQGHQASTSSRLETRTVLKLFQLVWGGEVEQQKQYSNDT